MDECRFASHLVPVDVEDRKQGVLRVDCDEGPRRDTSLEALSRIRPVFDPEGTVTAGNAPSTNDGTVALVLASSECAAARGLRPLSTCV